MYRYDFAPRLLHLAGLGATHATELFAVFGRRGVGVRTLTALGGRKGLRAVTETMQRHWLEFAHSGPPLDSWPRYSSEHRDTLIIDEVCRVECDRRAAAGRHGSDTGTVIRSRMGYRCEFATKSQAVGDLDGDARTASGR